MPPEFPANAFLMCPLCGQHRKVVASGHNALLREAEGARPWPVLILGSWPVPPSYLVSFRDLRGGRGSGFHTLATLSLAEAATDPTWRVQVQGLVDWCARVLRYCATLGIEPPVE
jgi:hypothetical protein